MTLLLASLFAACAGDETASNARLDHSPTGVANAAQRGNCNDDCMNILRAGVQWVIRERGVALGAIVVDTTRSGTLHNGMSTVPRPALDAVLTEVGIATGREDFSCAGRKTGSGFFSSSRQRLDAPACETRNRQVFVAFGPPFQDVDTVGTATLQVGLSNTRFVPEVGEFRREARGFELSLQKGATGWVVRKARLTKMS